MLHINGADITQKAYSASYRMDDALNKPLTIPFRTKHGKALTVTPNEVPVLVPQEDSKARRTSREERGSHPSWRGPTGDDKNRRSLSGSP